MSRIPPIANLLASSHPGKILFGTGGNPMATPSVGSAVGVDTSPVIAFCSDEDIARRATADFAGLAGPSQKLASGSDASFANYTTDQWTITSASVNFATQGVGPLDIVRLTFPRVVNGVASYPGSAELLAVQSVSGSSITLRRIGLGASMGDPPCPPAGFSAPIQFSVPTLYPQILDASRALRLVYGLDEWVYGRTTSDLADLTQFIEPCVFKVLTLRYLDMARSAAKDQSDDYRAKWNLYKNEFDESIARLEIRFQPTPFPRPAVNRFGTRLAR